MMAEFDGKVVLVTGGTRGIGRACAKAFAAKGARVAICGRSVEATDTAAQAIAEETGGEVRGFVADVGNSESVNALVKSVEEFFGPVDILVNNAGITRDGLLMRMKDEDWEAVMATNLNGAFYCCRAVTRGMLKKRAGRIINLSSIIGLRGQAGQSNYAAAKGGAIAFTKALAQELASRNVTVNAVAPGYIDTDMTSQLSDEQRAAVIDKVPLKRSGKAEEVAEAVCFLASDAAGYITGSVLTIDGGLSM
jgi:3-oxoacyl-[acyl-carrier protein] reductase